MKNQIFRYLKKYSSLPLAVDRLIISAYLLSNGITDCQNQLLSSYLIRDYDEDYISLGGFLEVVNRELNTFELEDLIELFEFVVSPSDRIVNGAIYTPKHIREYIIHETFNKKHNILEDVKIADISCGCGGFLLTAALELKRRTEKNYSEIFREQIFGLDIQGYSVTRTSLLLSALAVVEGEDEPAFLFNLYKGDTLVYKWDIVNPNFSGFEIIVGNPPYVCTKNLDVEVKENLKRWEVCNTGNPDLYIPFFQIGFESLSANGILGFITMNTFFKSLNGRALRKYFSDRKTGIKIIDFGTQQIFKSKSTYTCICFIENIEVDNISYFRSTNKSLPSDETDYDKVMYSTLDAKKGWNLNEHELITRIENTGKPFGQLFTTRHGIATLMNDVFIFRPIKEDKNYYYLQSGKIYLIEKAVCRPIINSNKLSSDIDFDKEIEKVIFPYSNDQKPKLLDEHIFRTHFPYAYEYLKDNKALLATRDKSNGKYENWFAFGRTQSLERVQNKMFFPKYSNKTPTYIISSDEDLLFYNGQAIIGHSDKEMTFIRRIMQSRLFWYYIVATSKPYSSNYYSLNGNYIRNFGIYDFTPDEVDYILNEPDEEIVNRFIEAKYDVTL